MYLKYESHISLRALKEGLLNLDNLSPYFSLKSNVFLMYTCEISRLRRYFDYKYLNNRSRIFLLEMKDIQRPSGVYSLCTLFLTKASLLRTIFLMNF